MIFSNLFLLFITSIYFNFTGTTIEQKMESEFSYYKEFSKEQKKDLCSQGDEISCILLFENNVENNEINLDELIKEAQTFDGANRDLALLEIVLSKNEMIDVNTLKTIMSLMSETYSAKLLPLLLEKFYLSGNKKEFAENFIFVKNKKLIKYYIEYLIEKDVFKASNFVFDIPYTFSDDFYDSLAKLFEKKRYKFKTKSQDRQYKLLQIFFNFKKIRYKVAIRQATAWFPKQTLGNVYGWRANLLKAMALTKKRIHSKAIKTYEMLEANPIEGLELNDFVLLYRNMGYSFAALGKNKQSINAYLQGFEKCVGKKCAPNFLYQVADMYRLDKDFKNSAKYYSKILEQYPNFSKKNIVSFLLFWLFYKQKDYQQAKIELEKIISQTSVFSYSNRRASYWLARVFWKLGEKEKSINLLKEITIKDPATFYGAMASSRLKQQNIKFKEIEKLAKKDVFQDNLSSEVKWLTAFYLLKNKKMLNLFLYRISDVIMTNGNEKDRLFTSFIAKQSGKISLATNLIKSVPTMSKETKEYIKLQYSIGYEAEIISHADFYKVPPLFVFSLARQESLFNVKAVSSSFAIGLLQILPSTAQILANQEKYGKIFVRNLKKPLTNVRFAIKFISFLYKSFDGNLPLVAGGYNAGPGKIRRWIKRNPNQELDEFIEDIPIFQTRNYVKKVMRNYAVYHYLYKNSIYSDFKFKLPKK